MRASTPSTCATRLHVARRARVVAGVLFAWLMLAASPSWACPRCQEGITARAAVWSDDFASHLLVALAPFLVIAAVSVWVERRGTSKH